MLFLVYMTAVCLSAEAVDPKRGQCHLFPDTGKAYVCMICTCDLTYVLL